MGPLTHSTRFAADALTGEGARHRRAMKNAARIQDADTDGRVVSVRPRGSREAVSRRS
jgi:hypothetical protein